MDYFTSRQKAKKSDKKLFYKIYYQNESYKFEESDPLSGENFYGSWEDTDIEFKQVPKSGMIEDDFRIVGNPRNERVYFGTDPKFKDMEEEIQKGMDMIRADENWFNDIKKKAKENKKHS